MAVKRITLLTTLLLLLQLSAVHAGTLYNQTIYVNVNTYNRIKSAVDDLREGLGKATGVTFKIDKKDTTTPGGIRLFLLNSSDPINAVIDRDTIDASYITSDGKTYLNITAYDVRGLRNGIYTYMDTLGFRWYAPGDDWGYVPALKNIGIELSKVFIPDFELRTFSGTYGAPRNVVVDKSKQVEHEWGLWYIRNRFGGGYSLPGHSWNEFLWRNYQTLKNNPGYMALVSGQRSAVTTASKFCISDTGFQQLFIADMKAQLMKQIKANPNLHYYTVSVEPSDGEGDCQCDKCRALGSVSDRVFLLANMVAKEFQTISPYAHINLYAYNTHAAPPKFELEKNVLVQIIPYKYQSYAPPDSMIEQWQAKSDNLFIYDYYGLPIENVDKPLRGVETLTNYINRLKQWYAKGIKGYTLETSYSKGATGLGLYVIARLSWNIGASPDLIVHDYYQHCFGKAAEAVSATHSLLEYDTLGLKGNLAKAALLFNAKTNKLKLDTTEQKRLTDYKAYLHYLKLLCDVQKTKGEAANEACDMLMQFVYGTFYRMMVHNYPISEWLKSYGPSQTYIKRNWDCMKPVAQGMKFATVHQWTDDEVEKAFNGDCKEFKKQLK